MKYQNSKDPGSGHNLNQKQAAQPEGSAKEMVDKLQGETSGQEYAADASEVDSRRVSAKDQRPEWAGSKDFLASED